MIDIKSIQLCPNAQVDGQLDDGRLVEFKVGLPHNIIAITHLIVAMSNFTGGLIIFGIDEKSLTVVGVKESYETIISDLEQAIQKYSVGIRYQITHEVINRKDVVTLEIFKGQSTAYFSRVETSPARQVAYNFIKNENGRYKIGNTAEMRYSKVYKYMTIEAFLTSMYCGNWRFFEPSKWNDRFEQRFYCAKYNFSASIGNTPQLFATCVTRVKNNETAWKVYAHGLGLGAHCLQLELDIVELRKQLRASGFRFEEKAVVYENENVILDLHRKRNQHYNKYFGSFSLDKYLRLLSLKRDAYAYEQELRLFIIPDGDGNRNRCKKADFRDLPIQWKDVITKVRVDKNCSPAELVSIQRACFSVGINPIIKNYSFIGGVMSPVGLKDIEFEGFDIDDMPGTSVITIN